MREFLFKIKKIYQQKGIYYLFLISFKKIGILKKTRSFHNKLHNLYWFLYSRLLNKPLIHAVGDSHVRVFRGKRLFIVHLIGAATAYNLKKEKSTTNSNRKLFTIINGINKKRDIVTMAFGEIDARIHIYNEYRKNNKKFTIAKLINNTILNYGDVLRQMDLMGINFFVLGIPPASRQKNIYGYQFYASPTMCSKINKEFNKRLKNFCQKKNYKYIDIYSKVSDKNGFISREYAADDVHLNSKAVKFVREFLKKELKNNL